MAKETIIFILKKFKIIFCSIGKGVYNFYFSFEKCYVRKVIISKDSYGNGPIFLNKFNVKKEHV